MKTKCIKSSREPLNYSLAVKVHPIEKKLEDKYVGVTVTRSGISLRERITKENRIAMVTSAIPMGENNI